MKSRAVLFTLISLSLVAIDSADAQWRRRRNSYNNNCNTCQQVAYQQPAYQTGTAYQQAGAVQVDYQQQYAQQYTPQPVASYQYQAAPAPQSNSTGMMNVAGVGLVDPNVGYAGPGDLRTHLWNDHQSELLAIGINYQRLYSVSMDQVQQWHNQFHAAEMAQLQSGMMQVQSQPVQYATAYPQATQQVSYAQPTYQPAVSYEQPVVYQEPVAYPQPSTYPQPVGYSQPAYQQPVYQQPVYQPAAQQPVYQDAVYTPGQSQSSGYAQPTVSYESF